MKNTLIGLIVMGFTNLIIAQNSNFTDLTIAPNSKMNEIAAVSFNKDLLDNTSLVSALNIDYLDKVQKEPLCENVIDLEYKVSNYIVRESSKFDGRQEPFKVIFKASDGSIVATYNSNGKILSTVERFNNVRLPVEISKSIFRNYPNWTLNSNSYYVSYDIEKGIKKIYKVQIGNGAEKKNFRIVWKGNKI